MYACFQDETGIITPLERHLYTAFAAIFGLKGMVNTLVPQQPPTPHTAHSTLHRHAASPHTHYPLVYVCQIWLWTWRSTRQHEAARKRKWLIQHRQRVNRGLSTDGLAFTERGEADEAILEPHLNKVLREEILHYTVAAIRLCVEDHRRYGELVEECSIVLWRQPVLTVLPVTMARAPIIVSSPSANATRCITQARTPPRSAGAQVQVGGY